MALFEYTCTGCGRTEKHLRPFARKYDPATCSVCGVLMRAVEISATHVEPDGIYSYCPNVGDPGQFERRLIAQKNGVKVIKKEA